MPIFKINGGLIYMSSYVVIDLEMCKVPRGAGREAFQSANELIQIGAVLVDENYRVEDTFMTYVAPQYGAIDSFIQRLTGITRNHTKDAPSTKDALEAFAAWLPEDACLVAWSDSDRTQINRELKGKNISIPKLDTYMEPDSWIDCQELFADKLDTGKQYRLSEALLIADIDFDDGAHDALVDAINTARLFEKIKREEVLVLSPYLIRADVADSYTFNPFQKACRVGA